MKATYEILSFLAATLKSKKETGKINFINVLFNLIYLQCGHFKHVIHIRSINELAYILCSVLNLQSPMHIIIYIYITSQFGLIIFRVLNKHRWLMATTLAIHI